MGCTASICGGESPTLVQQSTHLQASAASIRKIVTSRAGRRSAGTSRTRGRSLSAGRRARSARLARQRSRPGVPDNAQESDVDSDIDDEEFSPETDTLLPCGSKWIMTVPLPSETSTERNHGRIPPVEEITDIGCRTQYTNIDHLDSCQQSNGHTLILNSNETQVPPVKHAFVNGEDSELPDTGEVHHDKKLDSVNQKGEYRFTKHNSTIENIPSSPVQRHAASISRSFSITGSKIRGKTKKVEKGNTTWYVNSQMENDAQFGEGFHIGQVSERGVNGTGDVFSEHSGSSNPVFAWDETSAAQSWGFLNSNSTAGAEANGKKKTKKSKILVKNGASKTTLVSSKLKNSQEGSDEDNWQQLMDGDVVTKDTFEIGDQYNGEDDVRPMTRATYRSHFDHLSRIPSLSSLKCGDEAGDDIEERDSVLTDQPESDIQEDFSGSTHSLKSLATTSGKGTSITHTSPDSALHGTLDRRESACTPSRTFRPKAARRHRSMRIPLV